MHTTSFLIGLIIGAGIISIIYWIINSNKKNTSNDDIKLLKNEFDVVSSSIKDIVGKQLTMEEIYRNISLKSDSIDKSVIAAKNLMTSGGSKSQGDWGERVLKTALENMGYKDGFGYESQKEYLDEQGNKIIPDVVVHLPNSRDIVIDSKVSMTALHELAEAEDESAKKEATKKLIDSVKKHFKDLDDKNYTKSVESFDAILMFVPAEEALLPILKDKSDIIEEAFKKKIFIVGPISLYLFITLIDHMWRIDNQSKKMGKAIKFLENLRAKAVMAYNHITTIEENLNRSQKSIIDAKGALKDKKGNFLKSLKDIEDLKILSVIQDPKKKLPEEINQDEN
ncbi:MAG: DNA recombination protein RmuC [Alphaproteobacteria bacterium]|jgi:DNA recombination protein RmuC|nr:DNA recombination protein RmuC [bacterium]MDG2007781.1 DNA recombination protein RmuC [Alphaproteobacteria bacterium]|tara:strand:- start:4323 stop:5339 length:1017 start_codon:yes stop_codon:yes gene_type:complete